MESGLIPFPPSANLAMMIVGIKFWRPLATGSVKGLALLESYRKPAISSIHLTDRHWSTLRSIIPHFNKVFKATLLAVDLKNQHKSFC